jgi:hypothetical protein
VIQGNRAKNMANKTKASSKPVYETVVRNIQKITSPTGRVSYRVRVGMNGETYTRSASSLKQAKQFKAELV